MNWLLFSLGALTLLAGFVFAKDEGDIILFGIGGGGGGGGGGGHDDHDYGHFPYQ